MAKHRYDERKKRLGSHHLETTASRLQAFIYSDYSTEDDLDPDNTCGFILVKEDEPIVAALLKNSPRRLLQYRLHLCLILVHRFDVYNFSAIDHFTNFTFHSFLNTEYAGHINSPILEVLGELCQDYAHRLKQYERHLGNRNSIWLDSCCELVIPHLRLAPERHFRLLHNILMLTGDRLARAGVKAKGEGLEVEAWELILALDDNFFSRQDAHDNLQRLRPDTIYPAPTIS